MGKTVCGFRVGLFPEGEGGGTFLLRARQTVDSH